NLPQQATVSPRVTLAPGQRVVSFPVTTFPVWLADGPVQIVASWGPNYSASATMWVLPPELLAVPISPAVVAGGTTAIGSFTFSGPIAASGIPVTLVSSNSALASVPAGVTALPGAQSITFPVTTAAVTSTQAVTIGATLGGRWRYGTLVV